MSLVHAILGLLHESPHSGYDLKTQSFDRKVSHFWSADQAQIYRTLDRLETARWVTSTIEIQQNHPNRNVYRITPAGAAELRRWQQEYQPPAPIREPFLVQFFFGATLSNAELITLLDQQIRAQQARLAAYQAVDLPPLNDPTLNRTQALYRLTLERGIQTAQATIAWAEQAKAVIAELPNNGNPLSP